jgi:hypothetical protein
MRNSVLALIVLLDQVNVLIICVLFCKVGKFLGFLPSVKNKNHKDQDFVRQCLDFKIYVLEISLVEKFESMVE